MNKLLKRQLQKYFGSIDDVPQNCVILLEIISESYEHYEKDRKLIERSIELSSKEMIELNAELRKEKVELKKAHKELKTLFENIDEVLFSVDMVSFKLLQMSTACEKVYGYTSLEFFSDGELWQKVIHPEDKHIVEEQMGLLYQGSQVTNQYRIIHRDKSIKWLENKITPTLDEAGQLVRIDGMSNDISDRKRAEIELEESFSIIEATLESTADGILVVDITGKIVRFNNKFLELWRMPREILDSGDDSKSIAFVLDQVVNPDEFIAGIKKIYAVVEKVDTDSVYFKDGRVFERYSQPQVINGKYVGRVWSFRDVTERKKSEKEILISNERYNLVAKATSDVIWDWNLKTNKVIRTSENMKKILGYEAEEANENAAFWTNLIHPDDLPKIMEGFETIFINPSEMYIETEYRLKKANGEYAYIYDKGFIVRDKTGKAIRMIGASQDISKLKENELQLQKHAKELAISNEELEQFAYVASHDLQEPLRMVTSFLTQLDKKYGTVLDEKGKKYIDFAVDGAKRMRQIILDLLEYSRAGRTMDGMENIDLKELIQEIQILNRKKIEERKAVINYDGLPQVYGHRSPLWQVFQNLINNALKYSKDDIPARINIVAEELMQHWRFAVTDNGIGIEQGYFDKIFIMFQRLHNKDEYSGTGMGLAITKKIIESMGGKIWLSSEEGKGSTFYFTIVKQYNAVLMTAKNTVN